jgi:crossover junction endodeoxyribonuclease RuvC
MRVLGFDPGTNRIGFGCLEIKGSSVVHLGSGLIEFKGGGSEKLLSLRTEVLKKIKEFKPELVGVEKLFFSKNKTTALKVAEARGVILEAILSSGTKLKEIYPSEAKLAVGARGNSPKKEVIKMVGLILNIKTKGLKDDTLDALAIAVATGFKKWD